MREAVIKSKRPGLASQAEGQAYGCVPVCIRIWSRVPCVYVYVFFQACGSLSPPDLSSWVPAWANGPLVEVSIAPAWHVANPALGLLSGTRSEERVPCFSPQQEGDCVA